MVATFETVPEYQQGLSYERNFPAFFEWALALEDPANAIPRASERLGLPVSQHPLGFTVCYLSTPFEGVKTPEVWGLVRANIYPAGGTIEDDIHAHGFDSISGVVVGELTSYVYDEASIYYRSRVEFGTGWSGYENRTDHYGKNHTRLMFDPVIAPPIVDRTIVTGAGGTYRQRAEVEYHRVAARGLTITIFAKEASISGFGRHRGCGIELRPPGHTLPPKSY